MTSDVLLLGHLSDREYSRLTSGKDPLRISPFVYRYVPDNETIEEVMVDEWEAATGPVVFDTIGQQDVSCVERALIGKSAMFDNGRLVCESVGLTKELIVFSPGCRTVAILSTPARYERGPIPFTGGGIDRRAKRYHEVFSLFDGKHVAAPTLLRHKGASPPVKGIWSDNGRYVVYWDSDCDYVLVVSVTDDRHQNGTVYGRKTH